MTLNKWEQNNIEVLTSREMGEWLSRRENRLLERIRDEIKHLLNRPLLTHVVGYDKGFVDGIDKVLRVIDKYKGDKENDRKEDYMR